MTSRLCLLLLAAASLHGQVIYDLLLKNGHVLDPANKRDAKMDIAITAGKIVAVQPDLPPAHARQIVDLDGYYVSPGFIDIGAHVNYPAGGDNIMPDYNALPYGVTTVVDAGDSTCATFPDFEKHVIARAKTRILAWIAGACVPSSNRIVGIAATPQTLSGALAQTPTILFDPRGMSEKDFASVVSNRLRAGNIVTHIFSRSTPQVDGDGTLHPVFQAAAKRGILFATGAGSQGLLFRIAQPAVSQGFMPDLIYSGMDRTSVLLPRTHLSTVASEFLNMGMHLEPIIERITTRAAHAINHPELGTLSDGSVADIAVFDVKEANYGFLDAGHARLEGGPRIRNVLTVRAGKIVWDSDGLSVPDVSKAGPYTNFK